jgi:predicted SAM-dependent methyltransferase
VRKLNLGCGPDLRDGWDNADQLDYGGNDIVDMRQLRYGDENFDLVVCNHALQMLTYGELPGALGEIRRVLKPGGIVRIMVPDMLKAMAAFDRGDADWFPIVNEDEASLSGKLCAFLTWRSEARSLFTAAWLAELLERNGFQAAITAFMAPALAPELMPDLVALDSRPLESIFAEGRRREG